MPDSVFVEYDELAAIDPIGELPLWTIQRAIDETDDHSSWAWEFYRQHEGADAIRDLNGHYLVYNPAVIDDGVHQPIEAGWYYLNEPDRWSPADPASLTHALNKFAEVAGLWGVGHAAGEIGADNWIRRLLGITKRIPIVGPLVALSELGFDLESDPLSAEAQNAGFFVRRPSEEAYQQRDAALAEAERQRLAERETRRLQSLGYLTELVGQVERTAERYERNRALVELQDAIKDYTLFYGSDPAAMAAVQPYQQALGLLWEGGQSQQPGLMTVPEGGYTGVDITAPPVVDDNYDRFRANPTQPTPSAAEPAVTPEQYFSRAYQAAAPFRAANVSAAPVFTDPRVRAPYTGVEVVAPTLRDSTADRFRANTPITPSTGQPTSAMGSGAYSAMLPTFDFSQPLGVGSIPPIAPVLPSVRQSSASVGTQMTAPTFATSPPLAQAAMGVSSPLAQYGEVQQSATPGFGVPVTPLQFGMAPTLKSPMSALPSSGLGAGVPATPPRFAWSPLAQPSIFDPPTRVAAKGNTGNAGRSAGKRVTASSSQIGGLRDSDPMDVWVKNRTRQVEAKNAIPSATRTQRPTTKFAPVTALPNDKNTPEEWVTRRYAELAKKKAMMI